MNDKIPAFLKKQTAATICCINEINEPHSFSCFFAFNSNENLLYYKSPATAYHSKMVLKNPIISGTIMPDKLNKLSIKGIQFSGVVLPENDPLCQAASKIYHSKFPIAITIPGAVWTIQLNQLKMTENVFGMMEKHLWKREENKPVESA